MQRCTWAGTDPLYIKYHDEEWGVPLKEDQPLFEFLTLEAFQAGLSWLTILRKRENFRQAFADFNPVEVADFSERDRERLLQDAGIIRNRQKIDATINNAQRFIEAQQERGSFSEYIWAFVDHEPIVNTWREDSQVPALTPLAEEISQDLKRRGFKFVGPTVIYAHMQATGMVNDHTVDCFRYTELKA